MSTIDRNTLKDYFNSGDRPTEEEFGNLIDSTVNIQEDKTDAATAIDISNDASFVTPKSVKKLIDTYAVQKVNNTAPDATGNVEVTDITGNAHSITGTISKSQVTGLEADLDAKANANNIKTINGQSIVGTGNITIGGSGFDTAKLIAIPSAAYTIPGITSPVAFPPGCNTFTLEANKTYIFKGKYLIANGTSHTLSMGWTTTGLGISSMEYVASLFSSNLNAFATPISQTQVNGTALKVLNSSTASPTTTIQFEGVLRCTTGGTISPLIAFSTPTSTPLSTMKLGSFIEFTEIGSNAVQAVGTVS